MTRMLWLCLLTAGAPAFAEELPVPPVPPDNPPISEAAPTPDFNARGPVAPASEGASVNVRLYRSNPPDPSRGFAPGSRFQTAEERKPIQTPGFSVTVPLR